jgi:hypothetical protein
MEFWTAFALGLCGSLHCAGMCGPLALALPRTGSSSLSFGLGRVTYNLGRVCAYACLGFIFGLLGQSAALAGCQRWASLAAGAVILAALIPASRHGLSVPALSAVAVLKSGFAALLRRRTFTAVYVLGLLNGFLPCGLVYVACAASVALGSALGGTIYMIAFGLGTVPLMLGIGLAGGNLQLALRLRFQKLIPVCLLLVGALLILRGMALGIPYLSPDLSQNHHACH